jgi:rhamnulokinase
VGKSADFVALDLGAESGRAVLGSFDGGKLKLEELHRFPNDPVRAAGSLFWDALRLWTEVKHSLSIAAERSEGLKAVGVDTWGVDSALLAKGDVLVSNPYHYRDPRTDGIYDRAFRLVPREEIFEQTGCQFMHINTVFQLLSMALARSPLLDAAETLLLIPNLFLFWLSGVKAAEFTDATTTQCYNPQTRDWSWPLLEKFGIPAGIFPEVIKPGTRLGPVLDDVAEETGAVGVPVIATATHDTAAAVAAVPAEEPRFAYLSSGTWSIVGVDTGEPVMSPAVLRDGFSNEGTATGGYRLARNVTGLWLVQELRREWARTGDELSYEQITRMAAEAKPFSAIIDPDHPSFLPPGDMEVRMREFCQASGQQTVPEARAEFARAAMEGLALKYRWNVERLEEMTGQPLDLIHIVGGGSRNRLLCQFTADATKRPVVAGPAEATSIGNVLVQALAVGEIGSLAEGRDIVRHSFQVDSYEPQDDAVWDEAYERFSKLPAGP